MHIYIQSYNTFSQNLGGGVQTRVRSFFPAIQKYAPDAKLFDKWFDKIDDCDLIHFFKLSLDHYNLMDYAKSKGKKIVLSSVIPIADYMKIKAHLALCSFFPLHTVFDLNKRMLDMTDIILAQTSKEKEFIKKAYTISDSKIYVIPNGVSPNVLNGNPELIRTKLNLKKEFVLHVGRVDGNKNQLSLIRALQNLNIPVVFIGGPDPADPDYFEKCKQEATEEMYFLGWIKNSDPLVASAYSAAKVVVLPSHHEIFGNSLVEGAVNGANLVSSNVLPIEEYGFQDQCWLTNPKSVSDIRDKVLCAYNAERTGVLRQKALEKYSWDAIARQHYNIYQTLF